jgi:sec-independent protein translocase protein TatC
MGGCRYPDAGLITQVILFAVVYGLYEVSIRLVARVERARNEHLRREGLLDDEDDDDDTSEPK